MCYYFDPKSMPWITVPLQQKQKQQTKDKTKQKTKGKDRQEKYYEINDKKTKKLKIPLISERISHVLFINLFDKFMPVTLLGAWETAVNKAEERLLREHTFSQGETDNE